MYHTIIIGAGSGGLTVAISLAGAGKKVLLVERDRIWGDCTNAGCIPSKALIYASTHTKTVSEAFVYAREIRQHIRDEESIEVMREKYKVETIIGHARFVDAYTVEVDWKRYTAEKFVIATGSHAISANFAWVPEEKIITNREIFEEDIIAEPLVIVWGGYIGCELAGAFGRLGMDITLIHRGERLIPRSEKMASEILTKRLADEGVKILVNSQIIGGEWESLILSMPEGKKTIPYARIFIALGREANTDLNLEKAWIIYDKTGIYTDQYGRTNVHHIFACGDCVSGNPQFTHLANHEGRGIVRNILFPLIKKNIKNRIVPSVLYAALEIASVGVVSSDLSEEQKKNVRIIWYPFSSIDRAKTTSDLEGGISLVVNPLTGCIIGATVIGANAGEILPILVSAVSWKLSAYTLSWQIFAYPTHAEIIKKAADKYVISTLTNLKWEIVSMLKNNAIRLITGALWVSILTAFFVYKNMTGLSELDILKNFAQFIQGSMYGGIVYIVVYALRPVILFPATLLTFLSGVLFGPLWGIAYTMIGENLSANFAYLIGRLLGKPVQMGDSGFLSRLQQSAQKNAFQAVLLSRLLFLPFDGVNYTCGFIRVPWKSYALATALGIIPWATAVILAGASVKNIEMFDPSMITIEPKFLIAGVVIFIASIVLARFLKKRGIS